MKLEKIIEKEIRPIFNSHGGDIHIIDIKEGVLRIKMTGKCSGCPSAALETEEIIRKQLVGRVSEIKDVILVNDVNEELLKFAYKILNKDDKNVHRS
ncbi:NifU family protein [Alloiococcus sp. CFN-8]|uniref:NifU family protein n=1 Tax=Alloiococcus sp. CFN-8 TaxID=3416081 RepID=UPI003CE898E6